jgi:organic hydroperoxide reductase OsmC/OhrA
MSEHRARIEWERRTGDFAYNTYNRSHAVAFEGGIRVPATGSPVNIPPTAVEGPGMDPEQAFVAAISSCHMLWFLHLACRAKLVIDRYVDEASGVLEKNAEGRMAMTRVALRPVVSFAGRAPSTEEHRQLHDGAHERCFISNSVKTEVSVEPRIA